MLKKLSNGYFHWGDYCLRALEDEDSRAVRELLQNDVCAFPNTRTALIAHIHNAFGCVSFLIREV